MDTIVTSSQLQGVSLIPRLPDLSIRLYGAGPYHILVLVWVRYYHAICPSKALFPCVHAGGGGGGGGLEITGAYLLWNMHTVCQGQCW